MPDLGKWFFLFGKGRSGAQSAAILAPVLSGLSGKMVANGPEMANP